MDELQNDRNVITGTLDNGLKYFVRANKLPAQRAEIRLVVQVGSSAEEDEEQGLAHMVSSLQPTAHARGGRR
jgi:zinc protease